MRLLPRRARRALCSRESLAMRGKIPSAAAHTRLLSFTPPSSFPALHPTPGVRWRRRGLSWSMVRNGRVGRRPPAQIGHGKVDQDLRWCASTSPSSSTFSPTATKHGERDSGGGGRSRGGGRCSIEEGHERRSRRTEARWGGQGRQRIRPDKAAPRHRMQRRLLLLSPRRRCPASSLPPRPCSPLTSRSLLSTNGATTARSIQAPGEDTFLI